MKSIILKFSPKIFSVFCREYLEYVAPTYTHSYGRKYKYTEHKCCYETHEFALRLDAVELTVRGLGTI